MLQITADSLSSMNQAQREALAAMIMNFPLTASPEQNIDDEEPAVTQGFTTGDEPSADQAFAAPVQEGLALVPNPPAGDDRFDATGIPWDERIHSSGKAKLADGTWRKKRGIAETLVASVEAELKALMSVPSPSAPASGATPPTPAASTSVPNPPAVPAPPAVSAQVEPAAAPSAGVKADMAGYIGLIQFASQAVTEKKITQEQLTAAVVACGVPTLALLGNRLDLVPQVEATLRTMMAATA